MTPDDLREAEARYRRAYHATSIAQDERDELIRNALDAGWTHARIAAATGLTRGRIGQIAQAHKRNP